MAMSCTSSIWSSERACAGSPSTSTRQQRRRPPLLPASEPPGVASATADARNWALAAVLALAVHGGGVGALSRVKTAWVPPAAPPVELEIRELPPPEPEVPPEPPPPPPAAEPPRPRPVIVRRAPTPQPPPPHVEQPPPPNEQPPAEPPRNAPPVFGVTMSSVVSGESGMAVPVGNTLLANPAGPRKTDQAPQPYAGGVSGDGFRPVPDAYIATQPRAIYKVDGADVYPPDALALGLEGAVSLSVDINEKGAVVGVRVLKRAGHKFDEAAT